ncbi:membrane protein [Bosea sp. WAO]|uniref:DMT family transporter n=1 Tax=Bosea sp. WAO TaxID=406341 RepID=UPI000748CBEC|nr:DMT family transporter [Bosea sp. WAO]KUL95667.1 membrane protein [Bosea sp. WAO]
MDRRQLTGILLLVIALQILPVSDTLAKHLSASLPVLQVIWARFFFHCLATGLYSAWRYGPRLLLPTVSWALTARSAALFLAIALFYFAIHQMPLTTALTLWFVAPFLLTILAMVVFKEKVAPAQWLAIAVGFLGIVLAIRPSADSWHWTYLVGLAAGVGYAVFLLLTRVIGSRIPAIVTVYQTGLVGCVLSSIAVIPLWQSPSATQWLQLMATGCVAAIAHFLIVKAFERAEASVLAPFNYAEVITATILGVLVFGDVPDRWAYVGLAIIILSAIAVVPREPRRKVVPQT